MKRREFLKQTAAGVGGVVLGATGCATLSKPRVASSTAAPPNLLLIVTDDQRWDALGAAGNPVIQTPAMDRLAQEGVLFENNFCTTPLCMSSRASMYTGAYVSRHGITGPGQTLAPEWVAESYFARLKRAGYRLGFLGKLHLGNVEDIRALHDYWWGWYDPDYYMYYSKDQLQEFHLTSHLADRAVEFIETADERPFCLTVCFKAPHVGKDDGNLFTSDPALQHLYSDAQMPVPPSATQADFEGLPPFVQSSEMRRRWRNRFATPEQYQRSVKDYYRLVTGVDRGLARMLRSLAYVQKTGNTVVLHTSDNGFFLGDKGLAAKHFMYEEAIRTPLIVFDPRLPRSNRGRREPRISLNVDIAPTLLELAGLERGRMDGRSLVPLMRGEEEPWREDAFFEHYFEAAGFPDWRGVRSESWAYCRYIDERPVYEELFDLAADPLERKNLASTPSAQAALDDMRSRYNHYAAELGLAAPS